MFGISESSEKFLNREDETKTHEVKIPTQPAIQSTHNQTTESVI